MGEAVNLSVSTATDDGPVFFCCKGCIRKYKAEPAKYAAKVAAQRKALADRPRVQVTCPVSKEPVNQKVFIEQEGRKVYFCCEDCVKEYKADPGKHKVALANSYSYQTKCPVMGEPINPKASTTLSTGETIYYCCKRCDKKLLADPAKYDKNLLAQGIHIDWEKAKATHGGHDDHGGHGGHDDHHDH